MPGRVSRITVGERTIIWCSSTCRKSDTPRESVNRKFKPLDACSLHAAPPAETRQPEPERKGAAELYRGSCSAPRFGCARYYRTPQGTPLGRSRKPGTARERGKAGRSPTTSPPCRVDAFVGQKCFSRARASSIDGSPRRAQRIERPNRANALSWVARSFFAVRIAERRSHSFRVPT
jgi:hypothetical protein